MRLSYENEHFPTEWLNAAAQVQRKTVDDVLSYLIDIHDDLKVYELQRGPGIDYGQGVTTKSRRLLLNTIAHLLFDPKAKVPVSDSTRSRIHSVLWHNYEHIVQVYERKDIHLTEKMFHICEATFDLASFPPDLLSFSLSSTSFASYRGFSYIIQLCLSGYSLRSEMKGGLLDLKFQVRSNIILVLNKLVIHSALKQTLYSKCSGVDCELLFLLSSKNV